MVKGGATLVAIGQGFVASFDEGTQAVLVDSSTAAGSSNSKITLDLAGTAWFASLGQQYYGLAYPYTASQALFSVSGAPLSSTVDVAVFP